MNDTIIAYTERDQEAYEQRQAALATRECAMTAQVWQERGDQLHRWAREGYRTFLVPGGADPEAPFNHDEDLALRAALRAASQQAYQVAGHYRRMIGELGGES